MTTAISLPLLVSFFLQDPSSFVDEAIAGLRKLEVQNPEVLSLEEWGRSRADRPLLLARLARPGRTHPDKRPAVLLVAGLDGRRLGDCKVALHHIRTALEAENPLAKTLETCTLYVYPLANPDGLSMGLRGNGAPQDEDRDGREGEDGPDDLDGDGRVVWMRIEDPKGEWIVDEKDPRLLRKADPSKGERGRFRLLREGRDEDGDDSFNEDEKGGVILDRNFPHLYPEHGEGAGPIVLSEPESLALAKLVLAKRNLGLILCYGTHENLLADPEANTAPNRRPPTGIFKEDLWIHEELGALYRETTGRKGMNLGAWEGSFPAWAYAHAGIPCLATRLVGLGSGTSSEKAGEAPPSTRPSKREEKKPSGKKDEDQRKKLAWLLRHYPDRGFVPWHEIRLPDGTKAEVGGMDEDLLESIPKSLLPEVQEKHFAFLASLFPRFCRLAIRRLEVKELDEGVYEILALVTNESFLPPRTSMADKLRRPRLPKLELLLEEKGGLRRMPVKGEGPRILFGQAFHLLSGLKGRGSHVERKWVIHAGGGAPSILLRLSQEGRVIERKEVEIR